LIELVLEPTASQELSPPRSSSGFKYPEMLRNRKRIYKDGNFSGGIGGRGYNNVKQGGGAEY